MIKTYRKKPVKIEAIQWMGDNRPEVLDFCNADGKLRASITGITNIVVIRTLDGNMEARIGDYIIKSAKGVYYPCKPDIFRETYEEVSETIRKEEKWKDGELTNGTEAETDPQVAEGNWQAYEKFKEVYDIGEREAGELSNGTETETDPQVEE